MSVPQKAPIMELVGVVKRRKQGLFKRRIVSVDGISARFTSGAVTALLGHNGAGKTTTIRMMLGIIAPDQGEIRFLGAPMRREHRASIGYMPEVRKMPLELTCREVLAHHAALYPSPGGGDRRELVQRALQGVGLETHQKKRVGQLSKGMARRLAWAQATIHEPRFLILDEPFSGLDPLARREMQGWMLALKEKGTTMLLCTHEFWTVQEFADELYVMNRGKLVLHADRGEAPFDETALLPLFKT